MITPPGHQSTSKNIVYKLKSSIYGLKHTSRQWNNTLTQTLVDLGFTQSKVDYSLFIKNHNSNCTVILVYLDDLLLAGNSLAEFNTIKSVLHKKFSIKDLGLLKYFLGLEISQSSLAISLFQRKYYLAIVCTLRLNAKVCTLWERNKASFCTP